MTDMTLALAERALTVEPDNAALWCAIDRALASAEPPKLATWQSIEPETRDALTAASMLVEREQSYLRALPEEARVERKSGQPIARAIARCAPTLAKYLSPRDSDESQRALNNVTREARLAACALIAHDPLIETAKLAVADSTRTPQPDVRIEDAGNTTATFPPDRTETP